MSLQAINLEIGYETKMTVRDINLHLESGEVLAVLGPNGCGKTTLFRTLIGILKPLSGQVHVNGNAIDSFDRKQLGKLIAYVPQCHNCTFSYSAFDVALMGRHPFLKAYQEPREKDKRIVYDIFYMLNISHLSARKFQTLSGGEKKLILIARALAQEPDYILMDEPTSELDINNTIMVLNQILALKQQGLGVIVTTHIPKEAKVYADKILFLKDNVVLTSGNASKLDDKDLIHALYHLDQKDLVNDKIRQYLTDIA